jgi:type I restriction enzyme M protein
MTEQAQKELGKTLWNIADTLRGAMNADDFRDYMLSFLFLRYLSKNYEEAAKKELRADYPDPNAIGNGGRTPLSVWYDDNPGDVAAFEKQMRRKVHYVVKPEFLWESIAHLAKTQNGKLLDTLQKGFKFIEEESFSSNFQGLFSEINLASDKLGRKYEDRNAKLCLIISEIARGMSLFSTNGDTLGDAYEYLIGQFAAGSGKKAGEFYTPQQISSILSGIVTLDSQEPKTGMRKKLNTVFDFACGSGSLLLNVRHRMTESGGTIGRILGMESNITTYNLCRMNMPAAWSEGYGVRDLSWRHAEERMGYAARNEPGQEAGVRRRGGQSAL